MSDREVPRYGILFVYGSLKRGHAHHAELGQARFLAEARSAPRYGLRLIDGYAALVPGARRICGELFPITASQLQWLDDFEGEGYERGLVELEDGAGAIAYFSRTPQAGEPYEGDTWLANGPAARD